MTLQSRTAWRIVCKHYLSLSDRLMRLVSRARSQKLTVKCLTRPSRSQSVAHTRFTPEIRSSSALSCSIDSSWYVSTLTNGFKASILALAASTLCRV